jgi:lipopolysaccharide/colanic/teichoic acid biosynthesis glycosyltransferase
LIGVRSADGNHVAEDRVRRALNVVVALLALVITLPVWVVIALAIKLTSPGPVLYKQLRVGLDQRRPGSGAGQPRRKYDVGGRPFQMYKFRTMLVDAERSTGPVWSGHGDCRVTPVGRVLRRCRLDELPQLINVLKGDMNVVGPRPERPAFFAELRAQIPDYQKRQRARPGITGHAQVTFEADSSLEDVRRKVKYDLEYLDRAGVWTDLRIMAITLPVLAFRGSLLLPTHRRDGRSITPVPSAGPGYGMIGEPGAAPQLVGVAVANNELPDQQGGRVAP